MTNCTIQTSGLTDGRWMIRRISIVGWRIKFKADEINIEQSRIWSGINASMAAQQTSWLIGMDPHNALSQPLVLYIMKQSCFNTSAWSFESGY